MGPLFEEVTMKSILYFAFVLLTILSTTEAMRGAPPSTDRQAAILPGARWKIPNKLVSKIPKKCLNKNGKFSYAKLMNKTSLRDCQVVCHVLKMLKGCDFMCHFHYCANVYGGGDKCMGNCEKPTTTTKSTTSTTSTTTPPRRWICKEWKYI